MELVCWAVDAGAGGEEEEELGWLGRVVCGLGEVAFCVGDGGEFLCVRLSELVSRVKARKESVPLLALRLLL